MNNTLYGAIAGDIAGSTFEFYGVPKNKTTEFFPEGSTFTDDTILTIAVADAIMSEIPFAEAIRTYATLFPHPMGGYGSRFVSWVMNARFTETTPPPYNSYGNGSAMRVSACAWAADTLDQVLDLARKSAECTHNHPEGIKGAEATAAATFLARKGASKDEIRDYIHTHYYDMSRTYEDLLKDPYEFHAYCQDTVPQAIISFLHSNDYESAIRNVMRINRDTDTAGAVCGAIAGAFYGVPEPIKAQVRKILNENLLDVLDDFEKEYGTPSAELSKPTHNSFQVNQERIWGCEYPFALDEEEGKAKLKTALDFGITHFIDLTEEGELTPYSPFIPQGSQVQHLRFPIKDTEVPTSIEATLALLQKMDTILTNPNAKIYLHCWGGVGRTCTIVACWIAWKQNTDFFGTLHLLDELWETCPKSSRRSAPDTQDQLDFIQSFVDYLKVGKS